MGGTGIPVPPEQTTQDQPNQQVAQSTGQPEFVPGKGSRVGGILSTLLGWKHREEMQKREERVNFLQSTIHEALTNPNNLLPREYLDKYIGELSKNLESGNAPNIGKILKGHADQVYGARDLAKKAAQARSTTPIGQAPPVMPQQAAPSLPSPPGPAPGAAPDLESGGSPTPFEGEAPAGGAPPLQNENPAVKAGAAGGGAGFNAGMPPPAAVLTPPPVQIRSHMMSPAEKGAGQAAQALPGLRQANTLALEASAGAYAQQHAFDLAEQQRKMNLLTSDPAFQKLNPLQQQEVRMRVMGVAGAMSNYARPVNLPTSAIPGTDFAPNSLTVDGSPIDPTKWYRQQQAIDGSNDIRGFEVQPKLSGTKLMTEAGPVVAYTDPRGQVVKVLKAIDGSPITDLRLLATIHNTLSTQKVTTVDKDGNPVTEFVQMPSTSTSQKVLPGGPKRQLPLPPDGRSAAPSAAPPANGTPPRASSVPAPLPQPLDASTRNAATFARTVEPHIARIESLVNSLDAAGKLGVATSRWKEFMAGKVGAGDPQFTQLRTDMGLFQTALGRIHGGAKGGGSTGMLEHFKSLADEGKMDGETLKAALGELKDWVHTYAAMGTNRTVGMGLPAPPAGSKADPAGIR